MFALIQQLHETTAFVPGQMLDGNGEPQFDSYLEMPGTTATGDLWNPPSAESCCGFDYR